MWKRFWELLLLSLSLPLLSVRLGPMSQERSQDRNGRLQSMKGQEGGRWSCDEGEGPVKGICANLWVFSGDTAMTHQVSNGLWTNRMTWCGLLSMQTKIEFDLTVPTLDIYSHLLKDFCHRDIIIPLKKFKQLTTFKHFYTAGFICNAMREMEINLTPQWDYNFGNRLWSLWTDCFVLKSSGDPWTKVLGDTSQFCFNHCHRCIKSSS